MTALFVNIIGITGEEVLVTTVVISVPLTLIMMLIFIKLKNTIKQAFHRTVPNTLKKED